MFPCGEIPPQYPAYDAFSWHCSEIRRATYDSMPDCYMLNVWVLISNLLYCMLQTVRKSFLISFEIGPASIELVLTLGVLLSLVKVRTATTVCKTYEGLPIVVDDQICD